MLEIENLRIAIGDRELVAFDSLEIATGERLAIVGESGSGKTLTVMSVLGLLPSVMRTTGSIRFDGVELLNKDERALAGIRGKDIGMVFQDPARALNPTKRIGAQIAETLHLHTNLNRADIRTRVLELMHRVKLPNPEALMRRYPHELSGGQQQRVVIAMAIACGPKLLIADEPTTALDVTVQQEVLQLILELSNDQNMAVIFVSHNLGVVQAVSRRIAVMFRGALVEVGPTQEVISRSEHAYTRALIAANPTIPTGSELEQLSGTRFSLPLEG